MAKTIDQIKAAVTSAEAIADQMAELGYLQGRVAGVKSRYAAFGVSVPATVTTTDTDITDAIAQLKIDLGK